MVQQPYVRVSIFVRVSTETQSQETVFPVVVVFVYKKMNFFLLHIWLYELSFSQYLRVIYRFSNPRRIVPQITAFCRLHRLSRRDINLFGESLLEKGSPLFTIENASI